MYKKRAITYQLHFSFEPICIYSTPKVEQYVFCRLATTCLSVILAGRLPRMSKKPLLPPVAVPKRFKGRSKSASVKP